MYAPPAGTPAAIIKTLHDRIAPIVAGADYRALVDTAGTIAVSSTPAELGAIMNKTLDDTPRASKNSACSRTSELIVWQTAREDNQ